MKVERIVNSIFSSNTYILQEDGTNDAYLVDVGDIEPICAKGLNIKGVFITHGHFDHIYGIEKLTELYPDCRVYTSAIGRKFLADIKLNLSKYHGTPVCYFGDAIYEVTEGIKISIFDSHVEIFETPGHNPSCLVFSVADYLFTGDAYIPGTKLVTNVPKADKDLGLISQKRIINELIHRKTIVCPGHGKIVTRFEY